MKKEFRLNFLNDGSNSYFPENTASDFRVKLSHIFDFENEDIEVGLSEIIIPDKHISSIRLGHNEVIIYRVVKKNRPAKIPDKNKPPPLKDALNLPKGTFLMPSQNSVEEIVEYINQVTQKYTVTRLVNGVATKKRGIFLKYEEGKVDIELNFGYGIHLGKDICKALGIKNEYIIPNKLGHVVMREGQQYETISIINEKIDKSYKNSIVYICTDLIKTE